MAAKRSAPRSEQYDPARLEREVKRLNELTSESLDTLNAVAEALEEIRGRLQLVYASAATLAQRVCTIPVINKPLASESLSHASDYQAGAELRALLFPTAFQECMSERGDPEPWMSVAPDALCKALEAMAEANADEMRAL